MFNSVNLGFRSIEAITIAINIYIIFIEKKSVDLNHTVLSITYWKLNILSLLLLIMMTIVLKDYVILINLLISILILIMLMCYIVALHKSKQLLKIIAYIIIFLLIIANIILILLSSNKSQITPKDKYFSSKIFKQTYISTNNQSRIICKLKMEYQYLNSYQKQIEWIKYNQDSINLI